MFSQPGGTVTEPEMVDQPPVWGNPALAAAFYRQLLF